MSKRQAAHDPFAGIPSAEEVCKGMLSADELFKGTPTAEELFGVGRPARTPPPASRDARGVSGGARLKPSRLKARYGLPSRRAGRASGQRRPEGGAQ